MKTKKTSLLLLCVLGALTHSVLSVYQYATYEDKYKKTFTIGNVTTTVAFKKENATHVRIYMSTTVPTFTPNGQLDGCIIVALNPNSVFPATNSWAGADLIWFVPPKASTNDLPTTIKDYAAAIQTPEVASSVGRLVRIEERNRWKIINDSNGESSASVQVKGDTLAYTFELSSTFAGDSTDGFYDYTFMKDSFTFPMNFYGVQFNCPILPSGTNFYLDIPFADVKSFVVTTVSTSNSNQQQEDEDYLTSANLKISILGLLTLSTIFYLL